MNRSRLTWGIICLVLAGLLAVLIVVLPPGKLSFTLGDANVPYLPPLVLGFLGIWLLATAGQRQEEASPQAEQAQVAEDPHKAALNKRMETIAWGLFLIMLGGFILVPDTAVKKGVWSIGVGLIMLGLNFARYLNQIKMSGFTTFLGIVSVIGGVLELSAIKNLEGAVLIIVLGAYLILKPWFDERKLFGKAEES
jgi:hypothetical protein